jgi:hypothetical protein
LVPVFDVAADFSIDESVDLWHAPDWLTTVGIGNALDVIFHVHWCKLPLVLEIFEGDMNWRVCSLPRDLKGVTT